MFWLIQRSTIVLLTQFARRKDILTIFQQLPKRFFNFLAYISVFTFISLSRRENLLLPFSSETPRVTGHVPDLVLSLHMRVAATKCRRNAIDMQKSCCHTKGKSAISAIYCRTTCKVFRFLHDDCRLYSSRNLLQIDSRFFCNLCKWTS